MSIHFALDLIRFRVLCMRVCVCLCVRLQMYFVGVATPLSWGQVQIPEMVKNAFGLNICSLFAANVHNIFEISSGNLSWNGEMLTQLLQ